jgi:pimeloyl-ACP methyl ester carboxylesterase
MPIRPFAVCLLGVLLFGSRLPATLAEDADPEPDASALATVPMPTLGGTQFWADQLLFREWRIQRNAVTGHCRLLDGNNLRHAWGTLDECRGALEEIKRRKQLRPMQGTAVILLHGLGDTRGNMALLAKYIERHSDFTVFNVTYPSTREGIEDHAQSLARIVENLDGIERIHFAGHSMGNIVVRRYLGDQTDPTSGRRPDPRFGRMVMIGPPNHGSIAATTLGENGLFQFILGEPGQQLGRKWVWLESSLATPQFEFGIIAGGLRNERGINPLLPGDNDGVVTLESTRLAGARDFLVVPVLHALMPADRAVQEATLRFLREGCFLDDGSRRE